MRVKNPLKTAYNLLWKKAPLEAQIIITRRCNLSCGYCTEYDSTSEPVPTAEIKKWIDRLHHLNVVNTSILGGEPLMHPDLVEIVAYSNRKNQVSITTNGFLIERELILGLNEAGLCNMEVSIDNLYADRTGYIQKTFKTLKPKLELLKEHATFDVHVNLVLCESTKNTLGKLVQEIRAMGLMVSLDLFHEPNGMIGIEGKEYVELWDNHYKDNNSFTNIDYEYGRALLEGKKPKWKCRAGSRTLYVDEFGKVQYCAPQRGKLDIPLAKYTHKDIKEQSKLYKGCEEGCSLLCYYRDSLLDNSPVATMGAAVKALRQGALTSNKVSAPS